MPFELTREYIEQLKELIVNDDKSTVINMVQELHPADIADIYTHLSIDEAKYIHLHLDDEMAADVLLELEESYRKKILHVLPGEIIAKQYIDNMDSDDAVDVLREFDEEKREKILTHIDDLEFAGHIIDLLGYEEDTAGSLMAKELITVNENWSMVTCLRQMRKQAENVDEVYYVYVVDNKGILKGVLSLKKLLLAADDAIVKDIYDSDIISIKANEPSEEVAVIMSKYDLVVLPVVDAIGRLIGRITIDDVVDVIQDEAMEDYQLISGITSDVTASSSFFHSIKARLPWLIIGMIGGVFGSRVIGLFNDDFRLFPEMAIFMPLIAAMGGNVGVQSSSIIVQALANNSIGSTKNSMHKLLRELYTGCLNGLVLAGILLVYNLAFGNSMALTLSVSIALLSVIVFASVFGTLIPLLLNQINIDPALATGPFITTTNDIVGIIIYLNMGRFMHLYFS